ncbi:hypothetical protein [Agrobacterium sp. T29]|uniref:hypothetical protein n=1 Tax=Agrobacterium sp. T29 TaxID=2580515 RepID=UPI00115EAF15|nr:hypothetical protein [Agrobacterium sp. T29]
MLENPLVSEVNKVFLNYRLFQRNLASPGKDDGNFCFVPACICHVRDSAYEETAEKTIPFANDSSRNDSKGQLRTGYGTDMPPPTRIDWRLD